MTLALPISEPVLVSLVFVRVMGVMLLAPIFGHGVVPVRIRAALAIGCAVLIAPGVASSAEIPESLALIVASELLIGVAIGFASSLVFGAVGFMSEVVSVQGGLGAASVLDPSTETPSVVVSALMGTAALMLFMAIGGHHEVIRALWLSFERIPIGESLSVPSLAAIASLGAIVFETGLRLAAPLTVILFISNVVVGALGRTIPQLNLIAVQLPAQVGLTLLVLALAAGPFFDSMANALEAGMQQAFGAVLGSG